MISSFSGRLLITALVIASGSFAAASPARAESVLNHLLPWIFGEPATGPQPQDTLKAPFGDDKPKLQTTTQVDMQKIYEAERSKTTNMNELNLAHRSPEQIGEWITSLSTQALSIDPATYDKNQSFTASFMPYARQEYESYLATNRILDTLRANNQKLTAFAEGRPILIQEGVLDGTYRWLFRVPMMLSYYDTANTSFRDGRKKPGQTQRALVNIQVGRVPVTQSAEGMAIERWSVSLTR